MQIVSKKKTSELEFIALMAFLMANVALSIDSILPCLSAIGNAIGNSKNSDLQQIITMIFLGLGIGQLFFGTISDSLGRKPTVLIGVLIFIFSSLICIYAQSLEMMLFGRVLQGIGLSAPRIICISIIRDLYKGNQMARIMSFISVIFISVPMVAPILGQFILKMYNWQSVFYFQVFFSFIVLVWFFIRQEETLKASMKIKLTKNLFINGTKEFFRYKESVVFTLISGCMTGGFMVFLSSSKQIFQDQYGLIDEFAYIFAGISFFLGVATFLNGSLVVKLGMKKLSTKALYLFSFSALAYLVLFYTTQNPPIYILLSFMGIQFLSLGFIFGNVTALAMQPIGHIAGIGASLRGFISTIIAVPFAIIVGLFIDKTAIPLFLGFLSCGLISLFLLRFLPKEK